MPKAVKCVELARILNLKKRNASIAMNQNAQDFEHRAFIQNNTRAQCTQTTRVMAICHNLCVGWHWLVAARRMRLLERVSPSSRETRGKKKDSSILIIIELNARQNAINNSKIVWNCRLDHFASNSHTTFSLRRTLVLCRRVAGGFTAALSLISYLIERQYRARRRYNLYRAMTQRRIHDIFFSIENMKN